MARPVIIKERCAAQPEICPPITACPLHAISYREDDDEPLGGLIVIDLEKCDGCGTCATICCGHCIKMTKETDL